LADYLKILSATGFNGLQVWKPARQQTWKSAVLGFRPWKPGAACRPQSGDAVWVLMPEETFLRRATEDWIGLSALDYSLVMEPGARAPGWDKGGPLAVNATG